jgi:hypothetical protein
VSAFTQGEAGAGLLLIYVVHLLIHRKWLLSIQDTEVTRTGESQEAPNTPPCPVAYPELSLEAEMRLQKRGTGRRQDT